LVLETKSCLFCLSYIFDFVKDKKEYIVLPKVTLREGESQQKLLRRFRKTVSRSGVMSEVRKRRWFISKNEQRRMDKKKAIRRYKKRARRTRDYGN
jgi:small subunit ribosomal protein S21